MTLYNSQSSPAEVLASVLEMMRREQRDPANLDDTVNVVDLFMERVVDRLRELWPYSMPEAERLQRHGAAKAREVL